MTWIRVCDGPGCGDRPILDPLTVFAGDDHQTEMHFCDRDCLLRWAARVPAEVAAVEPKGES